MTGDESNSDGDFDGETAVEPFAAVLRDEATWAEPPADLFERILAAGVDRDAVDDVVGIDHVDAVPPVAPSRRSWTRTLIAVAAASVAVFGAGFFVGIARDGDPPVAAEDELVGQLALVGTELAPAAAASVDIFDRGAGYALILQTTGLDPAPLGQYYEGWLSSDDDVAVSVGTFHMRGGDGTVVLWSGVAVADFPKLSVVRHAAGPGAGGEVVMTGTFAPDT